MKPRLLLFPLLMLSGALASQGATNTWTNGSADFLWNGTSANWTAPSTWANGDDAIFTALGAGAITVAPGVTAGSISFEGTGYNIGGGPLGLTGPSISTLVGTDNTISAPLQGTVGLTKTGSGFLRLKGSNTYTGLTTITGGALFASNASGASLPGNVQIGNGTSTAFLNTTEANQFGTGSIVSFANGSTDAKFQLRGTNQTIAGLSSAATNTLSIVQNDEANTPGYVAAPGAATLTINNSTDQSFYGIIRTSTGGQLSIVKEGTGTQEFRNSTTAVGISYGGTTTINNGRLSLNLSGANNGFSSDVTVNTNGILGLDGNFNMGRTISGAGRVEKIGTGLVTMTGATANTYTGITSVLAGTLVLGKTAGVTSIAGNINIGNAAGDDVLRLGASNQIADTSVLTFNSLNAGGAGGKLELGNFSETVAGISSSGGVSLIQTFESGGTGTGTLTVNNSADHTFDGIIRNNGGGGSTGILALTKSGPGTLTILNSTGAAGNSYSGLTTASGGLLQFGNAAATRKGLGSGELRIEAGGSALLWYGNVQTHANTFSGSGKLEFRSNSSNLSLGNNEHIITGTLNSGYSGAVTVTDSRLRIQTAASPLGDASAGNTVTMAGAGQLMYNTPGTFNYALKISGLGYWENASENVGTLGALRIEQGAVQAGTIALTGNAGIGSHQTGGSISGIISDGGSGFGFTKLGASTLTLTANNTYSGATVVQSGTLAITGTGAIAASTTIEVKTGAFLDVSAVSSQWTLGAAQTLKGNGTINGPVTLNGTLATGASSGTLTTTGNVSLGVNSTWEVEIGGTGAGQFDQFLAGGILTAAGSIELSLINAFSPSAGDQFKIAGFTGFNDAGYSFDVTGAGLGNGLSWDFSSFGTNGIITVIPETSSLLLAGISALGLLRRRR